MTDPSSLPNYSSSKKEQTALFLTATFAQVKLCTAELTSPMPRVRGGRLLQSSLQLSNKTETKELLF